MDIFCGYWATLWHRPDDVHLQASFAGAVTVILEALLGFLDDKSPVYYWNIESRIRNVEGLDVDDPLW